MDASERRVFRRRQVNEMKRNLTPGKSPVPYFQSDREAAEYFETHTVVSVWDRLSQAPEAKSSAALARKIRDRHARAKSPISLRLAPSRSLRRSTARLRNQ
jgi:hypothetical protein